MNKIKISYTNKIETNINCLVYGEAGAGKTHLCQTAPTPIIISSEGGMLTLKDVSIPLIEVNNTETLSDVHRWLKSSKEATQYETACIDSISEICEVVLSDAKGQTKDPRQAYGTMADVMSEAIRDFRDLRKNVYFTAKSKKIIDEITGKISYMPSVPGQALLNSLPYFFDEVFVIDYGTMKSKANPKERIKYRYLQTEGDTKYIAKDRSGKLLPKEKPDLTYIFNKILTGD